MTTFYVVEDLRGRRVFFGDIEVSPLLCGNELIGNPYEPDHSYEHRLAVGKYMPVSFDINPNFF